MVPITVSMTALLVVTPPLLPSAAQACLQWEPLVNPMTAGMAGGTAPMPASATVNLTTVPADCWFNLLQVRRHAGASCCHLHAACCHQPQEHLAACVGAC